MILPSRRNLVRIVKWNGRTAVRKLFDSPADWQHELSLLQKISRNASAPKLLASAPGILMTEYLPYPTLLDELERQERECFSSLPWLALRRWLENMHELTGMLPTDGNLRNFLWDGADIHGLDFEEYAPSDIGDVLSCIAAFILEYTPRDTSVKRSAARTLFSGDVSAQRQALTQRRKHRIKQDFDASFILLAGGKSTRMGQDKASLPIFGTSLLELQLDKARLLGTDDILISGERESIDGARIVPDILPDRGPLGGLHACLREAKHPFCIVLGVDMPLLPACELRAQAQEHAASRAEITLAVHGEKWEPLAGVYNSNLSERIAPLIAEGGAPVRTLIRQSDCRFKSSSLPEEYWINTNTPEIFDSIFNG